MQQVEQVDHSSSFASRSGLTSQIGKRGTAKYMLRHTWHCTQRVTAGILGGIAWSNDSTYCSVSDPGLFLRFCNSKHRFPSQDPAWQVQQDRGRLARSQRRT